jgi:hypothetical protein
MQFCILFLCLNDFKEIADRQQPDRLSADILVFRHPGSTCLNSL